jgi:transcriptional regulator with XRE-family HTH domain
LYTKRERNEEVLRITARYIAELHAGAQPAIDDYVARYPQYADAILEFLLYYQVVEMQVPEQVSSAESLSDLSRMALGRVFHILQHELLASEPPLTLLVKGKRRLSLSQLAAQLDISADVVALLEQRVIDPATIPFDLYKKLARILRLPVEALQAYLALPAQEYEAKPGEWKQMKVAERHTPYITSDMPVIHKKSFREVVETSESLSIEQKKDWYALLEREGL